VPNSGPGQQGTQTLLAYLESGTPAKRRTVPEELSLPLVGQSSRPPEPIQGEFAPCTDFTALLQPHHRLYDIDPVLLEITGVTPQPTQRELVNVTLVWKASIVAKLRSIGAHDLAEPLDKCHTQESFAQCQGCRKVKHFWNRCENFYCPTCQPALAKERRESIEWWTKTISQPKHLVLTQRNTSDLTYRAVSQAKANLAKLRRRAVAKSWRGGIWSLEITNEGQGWHLHFHLLIDAHWIDIQSIATQWGQLAGQDYAIVKVKDVRRADYLAEVTKYAVKGSQLAAWSPLQIATFVNAIQGQRTFGVFGSLYGKRTEWREWILTVTTDRRQCTCGCSLWKVYSSDEWDWHQQTSGPACTTMPNAPNPEPSLF